jgi:L-alanine-DL-glutamate epimerase-like enolase superfamily enzyme
MRGALSWGKASRLERLEHVLVRLITDTGHIGLAEAPPRPTIYGETVESIKAIIHHHLAPRLTGMDVADVGGIQQELAIIANNHTAKGSIDICLHEVIAATHGQTLMEYFNPPNRKIKVSYILGIADHATMLAEARAVFEQGVRVFKVKVGRNFKADLDLIQALQREFQGGEVSLYADANEGLLPQEAEAQLRQLAEIGLLYVEEPLPTHLIAERAALCQAGALPIIADDSTFSPKDLDRELFFDTFDILNIKTARTGYYASAQMLAAAKELGKGVMVGSQASSAIGTIRAAIFAGLAGIDYPCELSFFLKLEDDLVNRPIQIENGYIDLDALTEVVLDEAKLNRYARSDLPL